MLTHVDQNNRPTMVTISDKAITQRSATARSQIYLPDVIFNLLKNGEIESKKGPVFNTAIIAGTMAAKKTHELIPFCHPIPLEGCKFNIFSDQKNHVVIECTVQCQNKTGVEMEALTGANIAALTIYDMCKALSQDMIITATEVVEKKGGKSEIKKK